MQLTTKQRSLLLMVLWKNIGEQQNHLVDSKFDHNKVKDRIKELKELEQLLIEKDYQ